MRIQIVAHQDHFFGIGVVLLQQVLDLLAPIDLGSVGPHRDFPPVGQRFGKKKIHRRSVASILIVIPFRLAPIAFDRGFYLFNQLGRLLIHANHRIAGIIRSLIHRQHILHMGDKIGIVLGRNHPAFSQVRLQFVFLSVRRMVS